MGKEVLEAAERWAGERSVGDREPREFNHRPPGRLRGCSDWMKEQSNNAFRLHPPTCAETEQRPHGLRQLLQTSL